MNCLKNKLKTLSIFFIYGVSKEKIVNEKNNILTYEEFMAIDDTLDYLINTLGISSKNIEKCSSILYGNVNEISRNVEFLKKQEILFDSIESCLHVLSSDSNDLKEVYNYVTKNYVVLAINKNTSVLSCSKELVMEVEKLNLNKNWNLIIAAGIEFGLTTLEEVQKIIESAEFKEHPELFTSTTLAYAKLENIQKIIQSKEFKEHPELFTSQVLAHAKIEDISELLNMSYWEDDRFKKLLIPSIVAKSKQMIKKLPILFNIAEQYQISEYLTTNFLIKSPSQNFALINYLEENNLSLIVDGKLNPVFGMNPGFLKKKYNIDLKELIKKYPYEEEEKVSRR